MDFRQFLRQYPAIELMERLEQRTNLSQEKIRDPTVYSTVAVHRDLIGLI